MTLETTSYLVGIAGTIISVAVVVRTIGLKHVLAGIALLAVLSFSIYLVFRSATQSATQAAPIPPDPIMPPPSVNSTEKELENLTRELNRAPKNVDLLLKRARVFRTKTDYVTAVAEYGKVLELDSTNQVALFERGHLYISEFPDYDRAIGDFTRVIGLNTRWALAYCNRGVAYERKARLCWDKVDDRNRLLRTARDDFSIAISMEPAASVYWRNRGSMNANLGEFDSAISDSTEAIRLDPKNGEAYKDRAVAFGGKGNAKQSAADLAEAQRLGVK